MLTAMPAGVAEHVLLQHLLPKLDLRALQTLAQSCKALRALITEDQIGLQVTQCSAQGGKLFLARAHTPCAGPLPQQPPAEPQPSIQRVGSALWPGCSPPGSAEREAQDGDVRLLRPVCC